MNENNNNFNNTVSNNMTGLKHMKVFLFSSLLALTACGSGGGGGGSDSSVPTVSSTSPADNASNVARNSNITATFNEDILNTSVDASSFTLAKLGADNTDGSVSFDGVNNIVSFTSDSSLAILATYTATLSATIVDLSGNALASNYNWSFTTADGAWGNAELIETIDIGNGGSAKSPRIAFDNNGNALAVWQQNDNGRTDIWANRFDGTNWGSAVLIEAGTLSARVPQIAIDNNGNALAVWEQFDGTVINIWANHFDGTSWGSAVLIETNNVSSARAPQIAFDTDGNALAVWPQSDGIRRNIWANHFDGVNWGSAELIETDDAGDAINPQIAFDTNGNAQAVWEQFDGSRFNILANRFDGTSWGSAELIETKDTGYAFNPQIAFDNNGIALAVWQQREDSSVLGLRQDIWANRFDGSNWGSAELIENNDEGGAILPKIAFDNNGNALVVWLQRDSAGQDNIWANRFNGINWGNAELIETIDVGGVSSPEIAIDNSGNALAVWSQDTENFFDVWANRFDGTNWGTAEKIETDDAGDAGRPQIAIDNNGNALAVWSQSDGSQFNNDIWANRFE